MVQIAATGTWDNVKNSVSDEVTQIMVQIAATGNWGNVKNSVSDCHSSKKAEHSG